MKLNFSLNLKQRLSISQRLKQSLSILSLSNEELDELIKKELLENPFLEREENFNEFFKFRMYDFLSADFRKKSKFNTESLPKDFLPEQETLKNSVLKQIQHSFFSKEIKKILILLSSYLDEGAYLRINIERLAEKENISKSLMYKALKALQSLEPAGIGARNLKECLALQLRQKTGIHPKTETIVCYYLRALKDKKYPYIAGELDLSLETTKQLCRVIEKLQPNPAVNFSSEPTVFICPDIYIYKMGVDFHVMFNTENLSHVKFSHDYLKTVKNSGKLKSAEKKYLENKTSEARSFIHAVFQRQEQIKKLAYYIIDYQRDFFEKRSSWLKPLTMTDIAEKMSVNVSTISRTVNNKYAHTPFGLMPLKSFFIKGTKTLLGKRVSVEIINKHIKKWIFEENPENPLSDEILKEKILKHFQIDITRRRVTQYRSQMNLPPSRIRKLKFLHSQNSFLNLY